MAGDSPDGNARNGFNVVDPADATATMAMPVCRYYGNPSFGLDTHFYSASADECAAVQRNWPQQWMLESSNVFRIYMPDAMTGACPAATQSVYRTWNGRADTNHRYTMDATVHMTMMAAAVPPRVTQSASGDVFATVEGRNVGGRRERRPARSFLAAAWPSSRFF